MFSDQYHDQLERAVAAVEQQTSAEIVVVVTRCAGTYTDADHRVGALLALLTLAFLIYTPYPVPEVAALLGTALCYVVGMLVSTRSRMLRRLLTRSARRARQAHDDARLAFHNAAVRGTRERTGVLLFFSEFERALIVLPDIGIEGRVPSARLNQLGLSAMKSRDPEAGLLRAVSDIGQVLAEEFPPAADDVDEIPNRPRLHE